MPSESGAPFSPAPPLPSLHTLRAGLRVGRLIGQGAAQEDLRSSYSRVPYDGIYRTPHLEAGELVLLDSGLLKEEDGVLWPSYGLEQIAQADDRDGCEALLTALLANRSPLWLSAAASGERLSWALIPDDERRVLEAVLDPASREVLLLSLGRRFSADRQAETGELAERYVVEQCRKELHDAGRPLLADKVRRVSLESDQLGYDVTAPRLDGSSRRLECKGTRSQAGTITIYLSRNEFERGRVDSDWFLVACRVAADSSVSLEGWCSASDFEQHLPVDQNRFARWMSVEIKLPSDSLREGLPPIGP